MDSRAPGRVDRSEAEWVRVNVGGTRFVERTGHEVVSAGDALFLFGGTGDRRRLSDLHRLDLRTLVWSEVSAGGPVPEPRSGARGACLGRRCFFFGGYQGRGGSYFPEMLCFDIESGRWVALPESSVQPSPRTDHTVTAWGADRIVLFGGLHRSVRFSNCYVYAVPENQWRLLSAGDGEAPRSRFGHSAVCVEEEDALLVFGGWDGQATLNDLWRLDLQEGEWARLQPTGLPPVARYRHTASLLAGGMFVFGGVSRGHERFNDLHVLDVAACAWSVVATTGPTPCPRTFHRSVTVGNCLYLLGGYDGAKRLRDVFRLEAGRRSPPPLVELAARALRRGLLRAGTAPSPVLPAELIAKMWGRDSRSVLRGACAACACDRFDLVRLLADDPAADPGCACEHPAAQHEDVVARLTAARSL